MKLACSRFFDIIAAGMLACVTFSAYGADPKADAVDGVQFKISGPASLIKAFQDKLQAQHAGLLDPDSGQCVHGPGKGKPATYLYVCKRTPEVFSAFTSNYTEAVAPLAAKDANKLQMGVQAMALFTCANTHCVADGFTPCSPVLIFGAYVCYHRQVFPTPGHNCVL